MTRLEGVPWAGANGVGGAFCVEWLHRRSHPRLIPACLARLLQFAPCPEFSNSNVTKCHSWLLPACIQKILLVTKRESSLSEAELKLPTLSEHIGNLRQAIEAKAINSSPAVPTASYYDSADLKLWRRDSGLRVRYEDGRHPRRVALGSGATRS
jgi:hypothetical protein